MKVALVIPPIDEKLSFYGKEFDWGWWQPLGLLAIASYLKNRIPDIGIMILDEQVDGDIETIENKIKNFKPDWLGVSPNFFTYENSIALARLGKSIGSQVVFGGHYTTSRANFILANRQEVDYAVAEDGEEAMLGLLTGQPLHRIPNLFWRDGEKVIASPVVLPDINTFPFIDYSLVNLETYFANYQKAQKEIDQDQSFQRPLAMNTQKGCRWREKSKGGCIYCSCIYPTWRGKDPKMVWREIMSNQERYNIDSLLLGEDDFLSNFEWFQNFYREKPDGPAPGIRWLLARCDSLTEENASLLKKLNCRQVYLGIESGSDKCLRAMRKGVNTKTIIRASEALKEQDIRFMASFVLGAPGETRDSLAKTLSLAERLAELGANHFIAYPLIPISGSRSWDMVMAESREFREICGQEDALDISVMVKIWVDTFCQVSLEEILETCDRINGFCANYRNPSDNWIK